ncbi:MAG: hypothetical protein QOG56_399, partial [Solirubrobacteraceae bacterium]|nr:hypothetical protein [Solirubrobacteraceae bacterium]
RRTLQLDRRLEPAIERDPRRTPARPGSTRVSTLPRERPTRLRARSHWLPSELVVGVLLVLVAATAATLLVLGVLRVAVA